VLAQFRTRPPHAFIKGWQVIGPFPNPDFHGRGIAYAPELDEVQPGKEYDGLAGKVRWKLLDSVTERVDVHKAIAADKPSVAYAVCWAHVDAQLPALLEVGSQDGIKVWLNPAAQPAPVIDEPVARLAAPGQNSAKIELQQGWNEIRVKLDSRSGPLAFFLELREADGSRPLAGIRTQAHPLTSLRKE
jgi:hypothetical protein